MQHFSCAIQCWQVLHKKMSRTCFPPSHFPPISPLSSPLSLSLRMYEVGAGVTKNEKEAVFWYKKAALAEDKTAQYNLGVSWLFKEAGATFLRNI